MGKSYLYFIVFVPLFAFSQTDSARLTAIAARLQKLAATAPIEKVYLQFNKPDYNIGDTIWFKGYITIGAHHQPSALSGVLYVELIDIKDKIIKSLKLRADNGIAAGDFTIDNNLIPGNYHIRAYTAWMRNAGPDYFFNQAISIGNIGTEAVFISPYYTVTAANANDEKDVNTKLVYTDKMGRPYDHKLVNYELRADSNLLYRGKGYTDNNGNVSFTFPGKTAPGQKVTIINHIKLADGIIIDKTIPVNLQADNIDIQFFPEGGGMVNDIRSKVAFKAIGTNGLGANVKGIIVDNENNEVAEFQSQHAGMGVFALTPQSGKTYTAKITLTDNTTSTLKLPIAQEKGFVLAVNNNDSTSLKVYIATNAATLQEQPNSSFYLVGQSGETIYYTTLGKLNNPAFSVTIPKSKFPAGIAQFTLFSQAGEPLNERVVFVQNDNGLLNLNLSTEKTSYAPMEKVNMGFAAKDKDQKPVQGSFSLTVYNEDKTTTNENAESTILSNILLTSDLKGYIESPNYYFNPNNDQSQTKADLDILMLTQGYRRFEWKEIMADNYQQISFKPERSLAISGNLTSSSGKPVKGKISVLSVADKLSVDTTTDDQGRFTLAGLAFTDTAKLLVQARKSNNDKDVTITLDKRTVPLVIKSNNTGEALQSLAPPLINTDNKATGKADTVQIAAAIRNNAFTFNKNNKLKEVKIVEKVLTGNENPPWMPIVTRSANLNGPGHANIIFDAKNLELCIDFVQCVINKIPGVIAKGNHFYFARHMWQSITKPPEIKFMLDGVFVTVENLLSVYVGDVQTVEVLESSSYLNVYGTAASGGLIIITTKIGNIDPYENYTARVSPGVITTKFNGFYKQREFYTPKYTAKDTYMNDTRDAVYWNPNIVTDSIGQFPVEYFNSDVKGTYRAVIEGIDNDGNIGRFVYRYKVQ